jgi:hypothetical protein
MRARTRARETAVLAIIYLRKQMRVGKNHNGYELDEPSITPETIEAGASVLEEKSRFFDERALARMVYIAMSEAQSAAQHAFPDA